MRKIAILRANGIGDFLFALPALEAMRGAYTQAEIVLLAKAWHASFLAGRPSPVDRVVVVPAYRGVSAEEGTAVDQREIGAFFNGMRREKLDMALQLHGGGKSSNPFVQQLGARLTVGLKAPDAAPLDRWVPYVYFQSEVIRYLEVVSLVGARPVILEPRVTLIPADLREAHAVLPDDGRPLTVLHPGAGDPQRQWPADRFAAVGDALAAAGVRVAVTGTEPERRLVEGVVGHMTAPAENLCCRLSLGGLAGLLSRAALVVASDSGPLHLAAAVGARTVGIFWCFNQITAGLVSRASHRPIISWRLTCPVCGTNRAQRECCHRSSFVEDVPVEEVAGAAMELLAPG